MFVCYPLLKIQLALKDAIKKLTPVLHSGQTHIDESLPAVQEVLRLIEVCLDSWQYPGDREGDCR